MQASSHIRNAVAYVLLTSLVLVFLNIYSANITRQMIYRAKAASLQDKAQLVTASFSGVDSMNRTHTEQVMEVLGELNVARVIVTDGAGLSLYDSLTRRSSVGKYVLLQEVAAALDKQDVLYCRYENGKLVSHMAMPVVQYGRTIGCVYIADVDTDQGGLIHALQTNIFRISIGVEVVLVVFAMVFAAGSARKMRRILESMERVREGEYSHKIEMDGFDEYGRMAKEFNRLTDRLQVSEQAQRQFVSDASHELKTPLAAIKLLSDSVLQNEMDAETMREFVADIGSEADRLARLAEDLMAVSKAEIVRQEHEVVDLSQTIGKVFKLLVPLADQRQIRLTSNMEKGCMVLTVEDDMYQIIFNLVENAIKYNRDGGLVRVGLVRQEDEVILTVEDTGIGIPQDAMEHIFERFYRVDKARSRAAGGSGLGLSIVRELAERNYGEISVMQRPEGGSCFTLTLPYFGVEVEL